MEVEELLRQVDILAYISQYCDLEQRNDGEWWGLSPFKKEKTPSFSVNSEKQRFYDFSTGIGGNLINFVKRYDNCGFMQAVDTIKRFGGISENVSPENAQFETAQIAKRYRHIRSEPKVSSAQILQKDYMERYEWRLDKLQPWIDEGIKPDVMKRFGVMYDSFSDRIVFPIKDYEGNIINVSGRTLDKDYKEKKLRKYTYFMPLGILDTLYGFSDNRQDIVAKKEIILFEGAKSVMLAYGWGIKNTAAILTSHLNPQQFLFLVKLGVRVVFALDKEVDIAQDAQIQKLKHYVSVEYIKDEKNVLSDKMSPADMGQEVFEQLYSERRRLW